MSDSSTLPKRNKAGRFTRVYMPVARKRVIKATPAYYEPPGRYGMDWDEIGEGLSTDAAYTDDAIPFLSNKLLPRLIDHVMPTLNPERKRVVKERLQAKVQRKRNEHVKVSNKERKEKEYRARRLTKNERRTLQNSKDALKRLKALLRAR